ncbi:MAG: DUF4174 domain-containing protein [Myxococcota bacterium]
MIGVALVALGAVAGPLSPLRWRHRVLVVHDAGGTAPWLEDQLAQLRAARAANVARELVVLVCRDGTCRVDEASGLAFPGLQLDAWLLQRSLRLQAPGLVFVGKDGQVKAQRGELTPPAMMHAFIDTLPMRQGEMR